MVGTLIEKESGVVSRLLPQRRSLAVAAAVVLVLSLVELFELYEFPFEASLAGMFLSGSMASGALTNFGYIQLFILMLLESAALPIPSEVFLPAAGYLVFTGRMGFPEAVAISTAAGLLGSLTLYFLSLVLGRPLIVKVVKRFGVREEQLRRSEKWISTKGSLSVFVARFVPGLRSAISIPAGILRMRLDVFLLTTFVGTLIWCAFLIYLGYSAGSLWYRALGAVSGYLIQATLIAAAVLSAAYLAYYVYPREGRISNQSRRS